MGVGQKESDMRVYDKYAKSMEVGDIRVENSLPTNREFSFIYCSHVIEHMQNPLDLINDISKLLKSKGKAVIIYPNIHSLAFEYYKENWMPLDPPRHLTLPSYKYLVEAIKGMNTFSRVEVTMKNSIEFPLLASECYKQGKLYKDIDEVYNGKNNDNVKFKESAKGFTYIINKMMLGDEVTIILTK
jgi:predicted SAM-dependent methyltransferase